jgi:hypothetical protein
VNTEFENDVEGDGRGLICGPSRNFTVGTGGNHERTLTANPVYTPRSEIRHLPNKNPQEFMSSGI